MIKTIEDLEYALRVAEGGKGVPSLKEFTNTNGVVTYSVISAHRYTRASKVDPQVGEAYVRNHRDKLAMIPVNTTSTTLFIRIK